MCNNGLAGTRKLNGFIVIRLDCTSLPTSKDFFFSFCNRKRLDEEKFITLLKHLLKGRKKHTQKRDGEC